MGLKNKIKMTTTDIEERVLEVIYRGGGPAYDNSLKLKKILSGLFSNIGIEASYEKSKNDNSALIYEPKTKKLLGELTHDAFFLNTSDLLSAPKKNLRVKDELTNSIFEDITFVSDISQPFGTIISAIQVFDPSVTDVTFISEYIQNDKKAVTIRIGSTKKIKESLIEALKKAFSISVR